MVVNGWFTCPRCRKNLQQVRGNTVMLFDGIKDPGQGCGGIYVLDKDIGRIARQNIPQHAASRTCDHAYKHQQE